MIIELIDGPLKGTIHHAADLLPDRFGLVDGDDTHWYKILYCRTKAIFVETEHEDFEYSRHIDPIIYGSAGAFNRDQFLDLAIAALDQCSDEPGLITLMRRVFQWRLGRDIA